MKRNLILGLGVVLLGLFLMSTSSIVMAEKKAETVTCAVTGEVVNKADAVGPVTVDGVDHYFCCADCQTIFKKDPAKYANKAVDIICGMTIDKKGALNAKHADHTYYFCSAMCKKAFEKNPDAMIKKAAEKAHKEGGCTPTEKAACGGCSHGHK